MDIYNRLPIWGQNLACYYEGRRIQRTRYGKIFWQKLAEYESHNNWSYEQLCEYRDAKLRKMVHHCYDTVPYYHKLFNDGGINPKSIKTIDDLVVLPVLTKQTINENQSEFVSSAFTKNSLIETHTNGTTGSRLKIFTTPQTVSEQWAVWWRYRKLLGIEWNTPCAIFGGKQVVPIKQKSPPYYRHNQPSNQLYFSVYHMNPNSLESYVETIANSAIKWLHGYPSALTVLAEYLNQNNRILPMKYVTIGSENLFEWQEDSLFKAFGVVPRQNYGLAEGVANISQTYAGELIIDEDFAAVELIRFADSDVYEIVGSSLTNFAMPLLRYKTNDLCKPGNTLPKGRSVISIDGRAEDYLILPDGTKIGRVPHIFATIHGIREAQIVQKTISEVVIMIVKNTNFQKSDEVFLYKELSKLLRGISISFEYCNSIPRSVNGKLRFLVSNIKKKVL